MSKKEFAKELLKKVEEEASALLYAKSKKEFLEELADIEIVVDEILEEKNINKSELEDAKKKNKQRKGGFKKRQFLIWSSDDGYKANEKRR